MISILVTGANGQLGRCLQDVAKGTKDLEWSFKTSKELDISNKELLENLFKNQKFDYVVNCAAYTAVDEAESDIEKAFLVNAEAVQYLASCCKKNNSTFIHISTDFVFDGKSSTPYNEDDEVGPINVYGKSKLKGEEYVKQLLDEYFIIRTSWVYSEYGNNFVKTMLRLGKERDELSIVSDQIGSPTYAGDLAAVIFEIISSGSKKYGVYHYSNEGEISWFEFAKAIFEESNLNIKLLPIKSEFYPTPAKRPQFSVMNKLRIKNKLNIEDSPWRDSLKEFLLK